MFIKNKKVGYQVGEIVRFHYGGVIRSGEIKSVHKDDGGETTYVVLRRSLGWGFDPEFIRISESQIKKEVRL